MAYSSDSQIPTGSSVLNFSRNGSAAAGRLKPLSLRHRRRTPKSARHGLL